MSSTTKSLYSSALASVRLYDKLGFSLPDQLTQESRLSLLSLNISGIGRREETLVLFAGSNSFGFAVIHHHLDGSNPFFAMSKPLNLTVSFSWLAMCFLIIEYSSIANFLRINIYLTQKIDENMFWNIAVNDPGAEYDPLTLLHTRTMFGRPDWNSIYRRIRDAIEIGRYLPGCSAQLRTKVGVRPSVCSMTFTYLRSDVLLWAWWSRHSHQGSYSAAYQSECYVHFRQGASPCA